MGHLPCPSSKFAANAMLMAIAFLSAALIKAQEPSSIDPAVPTWRMLVPMTDGRTFVTNGHLAIDAALAEPDVLPTQVAPAAASLLERYLAAPLDDVFDFAELSRETPNYTAPSGLVLNGIYVDYLRRTLPTARLRFRMKGDLDPVVILIDETPVGVLMPMRR